MLSPLTLGTAQLGLPYGINNQQGQPTVEQSMEILQQAYTSGVHSFDTAIAYGTSEKVVGQWINRSQKSDLYITTKIPSLTQEKTLQQKCLTYQNLTNKTSTSQLKAKLLTHLKGYIAQSKKNLGIDSIHNLLLHDLKDLHTYGDGLFEALQSLKLTHQVQDIGCSIYTLQDLEFIAKYDFDTIQLPGSLFYQSILQSGLLTNLKSKGMKTFVRSAFIQGLIFMSPNQLPSYLRPLQHYLIQLQSLSNQHQLSIPTIALCYLSTHSNVDSIVFGVDNLEQLKEILSIAKDESLMTGSRGIDLNKDIEKYFGEIPPELVDPRNWRG